MFRQLTSRALIQFTSRSVIPPVARPYNNVRCLVHSRANLSLVDSAKEMLHKANKKTGEVLANTIESTENVASSADQMKNAAFNAASSVNQKAEEILEDGIDKAKDVGENVKSTVQGGNLGDKVKEATRKTKKGASEVGKNTKRHAQDLTEKARIKAEDSYETAKEATSDIRDKVEAKQNVFKNAKGYNDLQDKGLKVESEQNRPDDSS